MAAYNETVPAKDRALNLLGEKVLLQKVQNGLISYCPTMDLIAVVTTDQVTTVYRINGQKVLAVPRKTGCNTVQLRWKPNGSLLAVAFDDNTVVLVSAQTGKTVYQIQTRPAFEDKICYIGWSTNFTDVAEIQQRLRGTRDGTSLDDVIHRGFLGQAPAVKIDLPSDLASIDVEGILPKVSTLPATGTAGDVFSTRGSLDALFHTKKDGNDSADVLLVAFDDGSIHLSVYDFFEIGLFPSKQVTQGRANCRVVKHSSHPYSSTHCIVLAQEASDQIQLYHASVDLRLISEHGKYLSLVASKATQLKNVLRYVKESQVHIYNEFTSSQTLPHRFLRNVEDSLQEKEQCDFVSAAYHLVCTGICSPIVKEWLVDELGERGQKRWEKASIGGYENTRRLTHENFLPALDRLCVIASRLRGLARFQETGSAFGLVPLELDHVFDTIDCLLLLGHLTLIASGTESRQSQTFCTWLRQEIDTQATENSIAHEDVEREATHDYASILDYIQGALLHSQLYGLFDISEEPTDKPAWAPGPEDEPMYEMYKMAVKGIAEGRNPEKRLPGMRLLLDRLEKQCEVVLRRIADTQKRKVRFSSLTSLGTGNPTQVDSRLILGSSEEPSTVTDLVAVVTKEGDRAKVIKLDMSVENGASSLQSVETRWIEATPSHIKDIKFIDDEQIMVALRSKASSSLLYLPYQDTETSQWQPQYEENPAQGASRRENLQLLDKAESRSRYCRHTTSLAPTSTPSKLEVNGRKGRRAVCVLAEGQQHYRIFDIDSGQGGDAEGEAKTPPMPDGDDDDDDDVV